MRRVLRVLIAAAFTFSASAGGYAQDRPASCTTVGKNLYVRDVMTDLYLWYRQMPDLDPATFDSPEAYLDAVRFRPLDSTFSYITSRESSEAFFSDSQFIGFGFSVSVTDGEMRVMQVFPDSPAQETGLARGDRIIQINSRTVPDLIATGQIDDAFGPSEVGVEADIVFVHLNARVRARIIKRLVTIPSVSLTRVYSVEGRKVGYVFFRNFVEPSYAALDRAFTDLREQAVNELVLDLRYNGGGLVDVAQHLASLIGGTRADGQVFAEYFHNDKNAFRNHALRFQPKPNALTLDRLVVITTRASASASELVINALKPFIPVLIIDDRTYGKPVGQYSVSFCDKVLAPVSFSLRNAQGEGDYFEGLAPTCAAIDDADHDLGDPIEASLREALTVIGTGSCSVRTAMAQRKFPSKSHRSVRGWQSVVGAY
jgi:carboxyl-terminal processing protease